MGTHRAPPSKGWRIAWRCVCGVLAAVALVCAGYCFMLAFFAATG